MKLANYLLFKIALVCVPAIALANGSSTGGVVMNQNTAFNFSGNITGGEVTLNEVYNSDMTIAYSDYLDGTVAVLVSPSSSDVARAMESLSINMRNYLSYKGLKDISNGTVTFRVNSGVIGAMPESALRDSLIKHSVGVRAFNQTYGFDPSASITNDMILNYQGVTLDSYVGEFTKFDY